MKRRRSLYARPEIVRGEQCARAPLIQNDQARSKRHMNRASSGRASRTSCAGCKRIRTEQIMTGAGNEEACEDCSEVGAQHSHARSGATGFPSRSACGAAQSGREVDDVRVPGAWAMDGAG
jgi:hypothetical protein